MIKNKKKIMIFGIIVLLFINSGCQMNNTDTDNSNSISKENDNEKIDHLENEHSEEQLEDDHLENEHSEEQLEDEHLENKKQEPSYKRIYHSGYGGDAYLSYLYLLTDEKHLIDRYTWQKGYYGYGDLTEINKSKPVVFADIYGDEIPELIFFEYNNKYGYDYADMYIYTFENGQLKKLFDKYGVSIVGGAVNYVLFQINGEKTLYMHESFAEEYQEEKYYSFEENEDGLTRVEKLRMSSYPDFIDGTVIYNKSFFENGTEEISEEKYLDYINLYETNLASVLMHTGAESNMIKGFIEWYGCPEKTSQEALEYLKKKVGNKYNKQDDFWFRHVGDYENSYKILKYDEENLLYVNWDYKLFFDKKKGYNSKEYNHNLAYVAIYLCNGTYIGQEETESRMEELGFSNIESNYYLEDFQTNTSPMTVGAIISKYDGEDHLLVGVTVRGTMDLDDIITDIRSGLFNVDGFSEAGETGMKVVEEYCKIIQHGYGISKDNTFLFVTGHSLGAAVAGQIAGNLEDVIAPRNNIYAYTFASPFYETHEKNTASYYNIHNIVNKEDAVPKFPLGGMRYGMNHYFKGHGKDILDQHMLSVYILGIIEASPGRRAGGGGGGSGR